MRGGDKCERQYFLKNIEKPKIKNKQTIKHYPGLEHWKSTQEKGNRKNELKNLNAFQLPNCKKKDEFQTTLHFLIRICRQNSQHHKIYTYKKSDFYRQSIIIDQVASLQCAQRNRKTSFFKKNFMPKFKVKNIWP